MSVMHEGLCGALACGRVVLGLGVVQLYIVREPSDLRCREKYCKYQMPSNALLPERAIKIDSRRLIHAVDLFRALPKWQSDQSNTWVLGIPSSTLCSIQCISRTADWAIDPVSHLLEALTEVWAFSHRLPRSVGPRDVSAAAS